MSASRIVLAGLVVAFVGGVGPREAHGKDAKAHVVVSMVNAIGRRDHLFGITLTGKDVWAVGTYGLIVRLKPTFRHEDVEIQQSGLTTNLQSVDAWDTMRGVAVGNDGTVIVTGDGGRRWAPVNAPTSQIANKLLRVQAIQRGIAYAIGEYNTVLRTDDFGASWRRLVPIEDTTLFGMHATADRIVIVGERGRVLVGRGAGMHWQIARAPVDRHLMAIAFESERAGLAAGLSGVVVRTEDGGQSWRRLATSLEDNVYDIVWDGRRYVACGARGLLVTSSDGRQWSRLDESSDADRLGRWFTQIRPFGPGYLASGSVLAVVSDHRVQVLTGAQSVSNAVLTKGATR